MSSLSKSSKIYLWFCLTIMLLVACTRSTSNKDQLDLKDGGFLSGNPCSAPCFLNITPGETTVSEAKDVLRAIGILPDCEEFDNTSQSGSRGIICRPTLILTFEKNRDVVSGIGFQPSIGITVAQVIKKYGDPNSVLVISNGLPESEMHTSITLYFDDVWVGLVLPEQAGSTYKLEATTAIDHISYFDLNSYQSSKHYVSSWEGFTTYKPSNP